MEWASLIPLALAFALSPVPLIELILVLFSERRTVNSLVFVIGVVVTAAIGVALGIAGQSAAGGGEGDTNSGMAVVLVVLGLAMVLFGVRNWRNRADTSEPAVLSKIGRMGPGAVVVLTPGATLVNPKNLVILLGAGQAIGAAAVGSARVVGAIVFLVVATLPYTVATGYALLGGDAGHRRLDGWRSWLVAHNRAVMGIVLGGVGVVLLAKGLGALA